MRRLSVIIPVYNVQEYLPQCVESVLKQIGSDHEIILIDDGSTDTGPQLCDRYAVEDNRIRVIHQCNQGLSAARNAGMKYANGEYLLFLDSDDILLPEAIQTIGAALDECKNADAIMFSYVEMDQNGTFGPRKGAVSSLRNGLYSAQSDALRRIVRDCVELWPAWKTVISRDMVARAKIEFAVGKIHEDVDWTSRILLFCNNIGFCQSPIIGYRVVRDGAITQSIKFKNFDHTYSLVKALFDVIDHEKVNAIGDALRIRLSQACFSMLRAWMNCSSDERRWFCQRLTRDRELLRYSSMSTHRAFYWTLRIAGSHIAMVLYRRMIGRVPTNT